MRKTIKSVTCFLHCGDEYLFVHRTKKGNDVDANRLNGIGGKVDPGENYLQTALRETKEETGFEVTEADCKLAGVVSLEGGYADDWIICFFTIEVPTKNIPSGSENDEGELLWLHKDKVLNSGFELVDDLNYLWEKIAAKQRMFFAHSIMSGLEKVESIQISEM